AANDYLYARNQEALPLWQRMGEACCAVLRGDDLYVGLAGEAKVYVIEQQQIRVFPPHGEHASTEAPKPERPSPTPLGVEEFLTDVPRFHCKIQEGSLVVLASGDLSEVASEDRLFRAGRAGARHLADTLTSLARRGDLSALLIDICAAESAALPEPVTLPRRERRALPKADRVVTREKPKRTTPTSPPVKGLAAGFLALFLALAARILTFFADLARRIQAFSSWLVTSGLLGQVARAIRSGSVALLQGLSTLTRRMLPEPEPSHTTAEVSHVQRIKGVTRTRTPKKSRWPLFLVLGLVAIVAVVSAGLVMRTHSSNVQFSQLMQQAQAALESAREGRNAADTAERLTQAGELITLALQMKPGNPEAAALQDEMFTLWDEVNRVVRLEFSDHVPLALATGAPPRVLLHENEVFVLDPEAGELRGYTLDESGGVQEVAGGTPLLSPDSAPADLDLQQIADLAWIEPGSGRETGNLLLLVNGASLLQLGAPGEFTSISVADVELWDDPRLIDGYSGYLYVLDALQDRILKYAPTEGTYDSLPLDYFQEGNAPDLENALDMAIDGYIFVLAGRDILKFSGGARETFTITGLEGQELQNPVAIFTSPDTQHLYIADAGAGRVVQLTKEGAFVGQFLPPRQDAEAFSDLCDLSVDEAKGRLLALTADGLFVASIHQLPSKIQ
ncbi:MAG: hypothetical protein OEV76_08965, partial [Anaerolineae bacterium]|nr:hypothetical protein [Anaerolineae bacterium]